MKKRLFAALLALFVLVPMLAGVVSADMGPKPSTIITVPGAEEPMVLTLLGDKENYGPNWAVKPGEKPGDRVEAKDAWAVFRDYEDPDGFLFYRYLYGLCFRLYRVFSAAAG